MVFVKILGALDLIASIVFLAIIFGMHPFLPIILFCAGLLLAKGMFIIGGDVLSAIDIYSAVLLLLSLLFTMPAVMLWISAFLLLAKGFVSFL